MNNHYRKTGFITCFILLSVLMAVSYLMVRDVVKGPHLLKVRFDNVGTLIPQEPVSYTGVNVGEVAKIEYQRDAALVTLEFYNRLDLPQDSRIINYNHSMMGARMIFIEKGSSQVNMDFTKPQRGIFEPGIAEMLHKADSLPIFVKNYRDLFRKAKAGESLSASLNIEAKYHQSFVPFIGDYLNILTSMDTLVNKTLHHALVFEKHSQSIKSIIHQVSNKKNGLLKGTQTLFTEVEYQVENMNTLIQSVQNILDKINDPKTITYNLIQKKELIEKLQTVNQSLKALITLLEVEGISDIISLWKNVHFFGSNPTKKGTP